LTGLIPNLASVSLLQLCVFGLCGAMDGDVGIRVFPQREKILIGRLGFGGVALQGVSAGHPQPGQRAPRKVRDDSRVVDEFLKFRCRGLAGFSRAGGVVTTSLVSLGGRLPIMLVFVDQPDVAERALPKLREMAGSRLITLEEMEIYP